MHSVCHRLALVGLVWFAVSHKNGRADDAFFENKVRPVLVEHCQNCHSVKSGKSKGGLLLDSRAALLKGGETGPAIDLKEPAKSRILLAMNYEDGDLKMPPKGKLPEAVQKDLRTWIEQGAPWPGDTGKAVATTKEAFDVAARKQSHWSWGPLKQLANAEEAGRLKVDPIDLYFEAKCQEKGIKRSGMADAATLYRRMHTLLTGMGPSEKQVREFLADPSDARYQAEVDRLLNTWEFAEHWARHWLDLVRYGETRGHEFDYNIPNAWQYRDYVIRALKADVSYRDLLREHLAGDLLPNPRIVGPNQVNESLLATGFFFLGEEVHSPVDVRQDEADRLDNRIDVLCKTFLGMTVACARCHDHKFDAISTKDYYGLYAMLESASYRQARIEHGPANRLLAAEWNARRTELERAWTVAATKQLPGAPNFDAIKGSPLAQWLADGTAAAALNPANLRVDYRRAEGWFPDDVSFGAAPRPAGALDLQGDRAGFLPYAAACRDPLWEGLGNKDQSGHEPGALGYRGAGKTIKTATFALQSGTVWIWMRGHAKIHAEVGSHVMILGPLHGEMVIDSGPSQAFRWVKMPLDRYKDLPAHLEFTTDDPRFALTLVADQVESPPAPGWAEFPRLATREQRIDWATAQINEWKELMIRGQGWIAPEQAQRTAILLDDLARATPWGKEIAALPVAQAWNEAKSTLAAKRHMTSALAPAILEGNEVTEKVFVRGSPKVLGSPVKPRNLEALGADLPGSGSRRLELANEWIDAQKTPIVPRVAVNRIWHQIYGRGIVQSVDNFGVLGDAIQNQELLDQLARDFVSDGWSIKKMIRRLVLTQAFRLSSEASPQAVVLDPENRLLSHFRPRRLSGESIRDNLLRVSGELSDKRFGPPAAPWINAFQEGRGRPESGKLDEEGRRSIYVGVRRNFLSQWMLAFDTPIPFSTVGRRSESHVPAQSLILMNHPLVHHLIDRWADKLAQSNDSAEVRIQKTWRDVFGREATAEEIQECLAFLKEENLPGGVKNPAAWKPVVHGLVNTRDFVFIR